MFPAFPSSPKGALLLPYRRRMHLRSDFHALAALSFLLIILAIIASRVGLLDSDVVAKGLDWMHRASPEGSSSHGRQYHSRPQTSAQQLSDFREGYNNDQDHGSAAQQEATLPRHGLTQAEAKHREVSHLLDDMLTMLPDELESDYILQQISKLGPEPDVHGLKILGLLARKYNKLFKAWEKLHLVQDENGLHVIDDVLQTIHQHAASRSADGEALEASGVAAQIQSYEDYREFITTLGHGLFPWTNPHHADHMAFHLSMNNGGRGIVLTGGSYLVPYMHTSILTLRKLGCTLPIEVVYNGDSDIKPELRERLEALDGVVTRDMSPMINREGWGMRWWQFKPFAMLLSSFREIIFIDSDSLFFKNPEMLFQDADYNRTGALFFRDRIILPENQQEWLQALLPRPISERVKKSTLWTGISSHMQESGVVVLDKWRHFMALLLVAHLNGPVADAMYATVFGDKETFWIGWELLGDDDYAFHQGHVASMGVVEETAPDEHDGAVDMEDTAGPKRRICSPQILHLDVDGSPLWFNGWLGKKKLDTPPLGASLGFEHHLRGSTDPDHYEVRKLNNICLTESDTKPEPFTTQEKQLLRSMLDTAADQGASIVGIT